MSSSRVNLDEHVLRHLPPTLTVEQAACLFGIGRSSAYQAVRNGSWPTRVLRIGRCLRIPTAEVLRALALDEPHQTIEENQQP